MARSAAPAVFIVSLILGSQLATAQQPRRLLAAAQQPAPAPAGADVPAAPASDATTGFDVGAASTPAESPAAGDTGADFPELQPVAAVLPSAGSGVDLGTLLPLLNKVSPDTLTRLVGIIPLINVTWVEQVLPYLGKVDPKLLGELFEDLLPVIQQWDPKLVKAYFELLPKVNPKAVAAIAPSLGKLNPRTVEHLVPAINAMDPAVLEKAANVVTRLSPEAWDALLNMVNLGVPGINLVGSKLSLLPVNIPAPPAFEERATPAVGGGIKLPFLG